VTYVTQFKYHLFTSNISAEASISCTIAQRVNNAVQEAAVVTKALASREEV
jgi:hypothetical protein